MSRNTLHHHEIDIIDEFDELNLIGWKEKRELSAFCSKINSIAKNNLSELIETTDPFRTAIALSILFLHSKEKIRIFTGDLNDEVCKLSIWCKSIEYIVATNEKIQVEILIESIPSLQCDTLKAILLLKTSFPERIKLSKIRQAELINLQNIKMHFTVCDENKFGFKLDRARKDICSFNDSSNANKLIDLFTLFKGYAENYDPY